MRRGGVSYNGIIIKEKRITMNLKLQKEKPSKAIINNEISLTITLAIAHALDHMYAYALPPIFPLLRSEFGLTYAQLGFLGTVRDIIRGFLQFPAGYIVDRIGHKNLLIYGFLGMSISVFLMGLAPSYYFLIFFQIMSGVSSSSFHPSSYAIIVDNASKDKVGKSIAVHSLGGNIGNGIVFVGTAALSVYLGWRLALIALAIPGLLITYYFFKKFKKLDNDSNRIEKQNNNQSTVKQKSVSIIVYTLVCTLIGMYGRALPVFLPVFFAEVYSSSILEAGFLSSLFYVGGFVGIIIGGILTDRYSKVLIIFYSCGLTGLLTLLFTIVQMQFETLIGLVIIVGVLRVISNPARSALAADILPKGNRGSIFGLVFGANFLGGSLMTLAIGVFSDIYGIERAFVLLAISSVFAAILILFFEFCMPKAIN